MLFFNNWKGNSVIHLHRRCLEGLLSSDLFDLLFLLSKTLLLKLELLFSLGKFFLSFDLLEDLTLLTAFLARQTLSQWLGELLGRLDALRLDNWIAELNWIGLELSGLYAILLLFFLHFL